MGAADLLLRPFFYTHLPRQDLPEASITRNSKKGSFYSPHTHTGKEGHLCGPWQKVHWASPFPPPLGNWAGESEWWWPEKSAGRSTQKIVWGQNLQHNWARVGTSLLSSNLTVVCQVNNPGFVYALKYFQKAVHHFNLCVTVSTCKRTQGQKERLSSEAPPSPWWHNRSVWAWLVLLVGRQGKNIQVIRTRVLFSVRANKTLPAARIVQIMKMRDDSP